MSTNRSTSKLSAAPHCTIRLMQVELMENPNIRITTQAESALSNGGHRILIKEDLHYDKQHYHRCRN